PRRVDGKHLEACVTGRAAHRLNLGQKGTGRPHHARIRIVILKQWRQQTGQQGGLLACKRVVQSSIEGLTRFHVCQSEWRPAGIRRAKQRALDGETSEQHECKDEGSYRAKHGLDSLPRIRSAIGSKGASSHSCRGGWRTP